MRQLSLRLRKPQKKVASQDSPNIGVCLCLGCWLEGGSELMGADALTAIRTFAGMGKLFKVHFRNVSNPMGTSAPVDHGDMVTPAGGPWQESLLDEGCK